MYVCTYMYVCSTAGTVHVQFLQRAKENGGGLLCVYV